MCVHTLLIYDNKSLASHNECDFVQHFLLTQPIHKAKCVVQETPLDRFRSRTRTQNKVHRRSTSLFFLWFCYDFGVTVIRRQIADAMVAASARWEAFTSLIIFKMADVRGGMPLKRALAGTIASAFWWIMMLQRLLESTFCVPYSVTRTSKTTWKWRQNGVAYPYMGTEHCCMSARRSTSVFTIYFRFLIF
jgi:hypothetical protein